MFKVYKYRLYPTAEQRDFLAQQFGNVRRVYNLALDMRCISWNGAKQSVSRFATQAQLVEWKKMYPYLALSNSQSLQYAVKQVDDAFTNWWKHGARYPMPKRKRGRQKFHNPLHCSVDWNGKTLTIPKWKDIPIVLHRPFYGILRYKCEWKGVNIVTIGRWDASSRTYSVFGEINSSLKFSDRQWTCMSCGSHHDHDYNARVNIKNFGLRQILPGDDREVTLVNDRRLAGLISGGSMKQEKFRGVTDAPVL